MARTFHENDLPCLSTKAGIRCWLKSMSIGEVYLDIFVNNLVSMHACKKGSTNVEDNFINLALFD